MLDVSDGPFDIVHLNMMIEPKYIEHTYNLLKIADIEQRIPHF